MVNSEDGKLYRWDLTTNTLSPGVTLSPGIGEAYTPTVIGPDGTVYAINQAILNAVGRLPTLSINDVTLTEGGTGTTLAVFTVTLSAASNQTVTVNYATADGTATVANGDYNATSGTLTFTPGITSRTITVSVVGDMRNEGNETFFVNLGTPSNATIADGQGRGTILNDDPLPSLSINNVNVTEGNTGTTSATFTVTLSAASGQTVTVNYATADGTATVANGDYTATSGTLNFAPGITSRTINVSVLGDTRNEGNETFFVNLSTPSNATIADGQGQGTILNDDPLPSLSINNVNVTEGNTGTTPATPATFTVTLSAASGQTVTVNYTTGDGTATAASGDYASKFGTLTFAPGVTSQTLTVLVAGDPGKEKTENFFVDLSSPTNATIATGRGRANISNDDKR